MRHDLENTGKETLRAVAFFAAAMFTQDFDQLCCRRRATSSARPIAAADPAVALRTLEHRKRHRARFA
jgi:hypothetical protein